MPYGYPNDYLRRRPRETLHFAGYAEFVPVVDYVVAPPVVEYIETQPVIEYVETQPVFESTETRTVTEYTETRSPRRHRDATPPERLLDAAPPRTPRISAPPRRIRDTDRSDRARDTASPRTEEVYNDEEDIPASPRGSRNTAPPRRTRDIATPRIEEVYDDDDDIPPPQRAKNTALPIIARNTASPQIEEVYDDEDENPDDIPSTERQPPNPNPGRSSPRSGASDDDEFDTDTTSQALVRITVTHQPARPGHAHLCEGRQNNTLGRLEFSVCRCRTPEDHGDAFENTCRPGKYRDRAGRPMTWEAMFTAILDAAGKDCITRQEFRRLLPTVLDRQTARRAEQRERRRDAHIRRGGSISVNANVRALCGNHELPGSQVPFVEDHAPSYGGRWR